MRNAFYYNILMQWTCAHAVVIYPTMHEQPTAKYNFKYINSLNSLSKPSQF